ncbi:ABC transporter substrate-binding protein [uncultured Phascolarctobacterium sp.]|uniref:ABC transporter substrate-binding protein n=1 Tax=uncultured Phascolarctobacterium sp. TaxID=512296 RepID=UPI0025F16E44|nr:ABC transporter substrate-binding protein [uncultured Phascolarctobacterium sp.]
MQKALLVLILLFSWFVSGCSEERSNVSGEAGIYSIMDARGKIVAFHKPPQRIVCLNYSACEILTELIPLSDVIATDKWAHEEDLSNCTEVIKDIPVCEDNVESILAFKPDLVILASGRGTVLGELLDTIDVKNCILQQPENIYKIPDYIKLLGKLVDNEAAAEKMAAKVSGYLKAERDTPRISGVLLLHPNGGTGHKGSMSNSVFETCNIENLAARYENFAGNYLGKEQIVALNPERLIVLDWSFGGQHKSAAARKKEVLEDPGYQSIDAVKNGRVIILPMKYFNCNTQYVINNMEKLKKELAKTV